MQRRLLYVESDDHAGNVRGLLSPKTLLPDDSDEDEIIYYTPQLRKWQRYLWELRERNLERLIELAGNDPIYYLHLGDLTQGNKYVSDWVTTRIGDQFLIAIANHRPIMELPNLRLARYVEGTGSHEFGDGTSGGVVTGQLSAEYPDVDIKRCSHGEIDIAGLTVDYAHHGPTPGQQKKWLEGSAASWNLRGWMIDSRLRGNDPPKLYLRAHYHVWRWVTWHLSIDETDYTSHLCIIPSMCGLGAYGRQATRSVHMIRNGALCFEILGDEILGIHRWTKTVDTRLREVVS